MCLEGYLAFIVFPDTRTLSVHWEKVDGSMSPGNWGTFHIWGRFLCLHVPKYLLEVVHLLRILNTGGVGGAWDNRELSVGCRLLV